MFAKKNLHLKEKKLSAVGVPASKSGKNRLSGRFFMFLLVLVVSVILILATSALAGTWKIDFEDGNLDEWEVIKADEWKKINPAWVVGGVAGLGIQLEEEAWSVENGILVGNNMRGGDCIAIGDSSWKDYSIQANIKILEAIPSAQHGASITIRFADVNKSYFATIVPLLNPRVVIKARPKFAFPWMDVLCGVKLNTWYKLKMVAKNTHFEVYLDDALIKAFDDDTVASGRVALGIFKVHAHFDDVIIEGDEIPKGGPYVIKAKNKMAATWGKMKQAH